MGALEHEFGHRPGDGSTDVGKSSGMRETLRLSLENLPEEALGPDVECMGNPWTPFEATQRGERPFLSIVCGLPDRLRVVMHTIKHLEAKGFPCLFWLRTPGPSELDIACGTSVNPKARVMLFWRTTVLPAVKKLAELTGCQDFLICEGNVVLADDVDFSTVAVCIQKPASVWGYGNTLIDFQWATLLVRL